MLTLDTATSNRHQQPVAIARTGPKPLEQAPTAVNVTVTKRGPIGKSHRVGTMVGNVTVWPALAVFHDGRKIYGSNAYVAEKQLVQVRTPKGEKSAQVDGSKPDNLARSLLIELAKEGKA